MEVIIEVRNAKVGIWHFAMGKAGYPKTVTIEKIRMVFEIWAMRIVFVQTAGNAIISKHSYVM